MEQKLQMLTRLFADLDTDFHTMGDKPNGVNINDGVLDQHIQKR